MTMLSTPALLAYTPFIDPIDVHEWWMPFIIPLALGVSMVYRATREPTLNHYWKRTIMMTVQVLLVMVALAVAFTLLVEVYVRWFASL